MTFARFSMPKLNCPCGTIHKLSPIPDSGWITIPDRKFEGVVAFWAQKRESYADLSLEERAAHDKELWEATAPQGRLYECGVCGRLMWRREGETDFRIYSREDTV